MNRIQFKSKSKAEQPVLEIDGTEEARVPSIFSDLSKVPSRPDPEVSKKKYRRRFIPTYKLRILKEYDACQKSGEIASLLRSEGLIIQTSIRGSGNVMKVFCMVLHPRNVAGNPERSTP